MKTSVSLALGLSLAANAALVVTFVLRSGDEAGQTAAGTTTTMRSAQEELENQFKAVLGEDRYANYRRSSNTDYRAASSVVEHFKLPGENAVAVYELAQDMEQRARALQTDRNLRRNNGTPG